MPYPNYHAIRIAAPSKFSKLRYVKSKFGAGIDAIVGKPKGGGGWKIQALRFDKSKFSFAEAKKWAQSHGYTPKLAEAALARAASKRSP